MSKLHLYIFFLFFSFFCLDKPECKSLESQEGGGQPGFQEQQLWSSLPAVHRGTDDRPQQHQDQRKTVLQQSHSRSQGEQQRWWWDWSEQPKVVVFATNVFVFLYTVKLQTLLAEIVNSVMQDFQRTSAYTCLAVEEETRRNALVLWLKGNAGFVRPSKHFWQMPLPGNTGDFIRIIGTICGCLKEPLIYLFSSYAGN